MFLSAGSGVRCCILGGLLEQPGAAVMGAPGQGLWESVAEYWQVAFRRLASRI